MVKRKYLDELLSQNGVLPACSSQDCASLGGEASIKIMKLSRMICKTTKR